jgi:hypothetical protein
MSFVETGQVAPTIVRRAENGCACRGSTYFSKHLAYYTGDTALLCSNRAETYEDAAFLKDGEQEPREVQRGFRSKGM